MLDTILQEKADLTVNLLSFLRLLLIYKNKVLNYYQCHPRLDRGSMAEPSVTKQRCFYIQGLGHGSPVKPGMTSRNKKS
jgi:hypothetical protein